jgi:excisionase family DNA binding protein
MQYKSGDILTIQELADYLKIPRSTLYKIVRQGVLPCQKIGRHWRFHKSAIDQWFDKPGTGASSSGKKAKTMNQGVGNGIRSQPGGESLKKLSDILQEVVRRIVDAAHPLRIILFGSAARGKVDRDSDLDLLIVMPEGTHRRRISQRVYRALRGIDMPKDIVVVTERDIADYGNDPSLVVKPALDDGVELYASE